MVALSAPIFAADDDALTVGVWCCGLKRFGILESDCLLLGGVFALETAAVAWGFACLEGVWSENLFAVMILAGGVFDLVLMFLSALRRRSLKNREIIRHSGGATKLSVFCFSSLSNLRTWSIPLRISRIAFDIAS